MVQMTGSYKLEKNENLDEYFKIVGVPFMPRKIMCMSSPTMEIKNENEDWIITIATMLRTVVLKFKLGEEYDEHMPGGVIKSTTILEGDSLKTSSLIPNGKKVSRVYEFSESGCVMILKHEESGVEARRYFKRI